MKIDSHQHFWRFNESEFGWVEPALRRDFLPEDLEPELLAAGYDGCIAVQAPQTLRETEFLLDQAKRHDFILGIVGWVDLCSPEALVQLERFAARDKFCGVRHIVQGEPDDFMLRADFQRGLSCLHEFDLAYDILIVPSQLDNAYRLAASFPHQRFVVDHLAKPRIADGLKESWATGIRRLGELPNVRCKLSGMVSEAAQNWHGNDFRPYVDVALEAFGPSRLMIGSDWPVSLARGAYGDVMDTYESLVETLSEPERAQILGSNAAEFYRI